jgi:hypothetical protein
MNTASAATEINPFQRPYAAIPFGDAFKNKHLLSVRSIHGEPIRDF